MCSIECPKNANKLRKKESLVNDFIQKYDFSRKFSGISPDSDPVICPATELDCAVLK